MKRNYLSVNDFAEAAGISRQAVYQQIDKKLKKFVKVEQGKKVIDEAALTEIYHIKYEEVDQESQVKIDKLEQENQELIELLKEQIKIKDRQLTEQNKQLEEKDQQIKSILQSLDQAQKLHARAEQDLLELKAESAVAEPDPEQQTAAGTGWWQRIKGLF